MLNYGTLISLMHLLLKKIFHIKELFLAVMFLFTLIGVEYMQASLNHKALEIVLMLWSRHAMF